MKNSIFTLMLVLLILGSTACNNDDSTAGLIPDEYSTILSLKQSGTETLSLDETTIGKFETNLIVLKGGKKTQSVVKAKVDVFTSDELNTYNSESGGSFEILPSNCYMIDNSEFEIGDKEGETGKKIALTIDREAVIAAINAFWEDNPEKQSPYILPIRLTSSEADVLNEKRDLIYSFNYTKPIPPEPVTPEWYVETFLGGEHGNPFNGPRNLAMKNGKLYVLDHHETIKEIDLSSKTIKDFYDLRNEPAITAAKSLSCGHDGTFYMGAKNGVWAVSPEGVATQKAGGEIHDVAESPTDGELFFINGGESFINLYDGDTNPSVSEGYEWWSEGQMAWDPTGEHVYIAIQGGNNQIDRFTYNKESKTFDKKEAALYKSESLLIHPKQMVFDSKGNMYVVSKESQVVVKITPEGEMIRLAGIAGQKGNANGKALEATFDTPYGITLVETDDPDHPTLYVGDTGNFAIRKIVYESREE